MITPRFLGPLAVELVGYREGRAAWRLLRDLRYDSALARARLVVPAGFVTDFASVPRAPLAFLLAGDTAHAAAVVHDYLYQARPLRGGLPGAGRELADAVFLEAMRATGIPAWRRHLMYLAVRAAGAGAWDASTIRLAELNPALGPQTALALGPDEGAALA